ncbi:MAG: SDR family NAD(P)-dependent oxidoreductase, partial [Pseudomonadota bacterium]
MNRMDGKIAFISGGARGLGAATARMMAECGASVVIGDLLDEAGAQTVADIRAKGGKALYTHLDVTGEDSWRNAVKAGVDAF